MSKRMAEIKRTTKETDIHIKVTIDGAGESRIATGMAFLDHMLTLLAKHSLMDVTIAAKGDLEVDYHHTVEDLGLALGQALNKALGDRRGITRYGSIMLPMDDALSQVAVDLGGRPFLVQQIDCKRRKILDFDLGLITEFFRAFVVEARLNLHIRQLYGTDPHHAYESIFKGVGRALGMACTKDPRVRGVPSSKGTI